ncbi:hypothetical protein BKA69DRAFT_1129519 [Paraphysoderma sedebokerense]|nr:hypothetical protein BKA69DRAFT_1129519 [Paraphysoderma sedebokerense]
MNQIKFDSSYKDLSRGTNSKVLLSPPARSGSKSFTHFGAQDLTLGFEPQLEVFKGNSLSKEEFLTLMIDTALGVQYLNRHFVVSGDLTPKNLYGFTDGNGTLKWRWGQWKTAYAPLELHNSGSTITTAVDIFMLATTWLYVDTRSNIEDLAQEKAEHKDPARTVTAESSFVISIQSYPTLS